MQHTKIVAQLVRHYSSSACDDMVRRVSRESGWVGVRTHQIMVRFPYYGSIKVVVTAAQQMYVVHIGEPFQSRVAAELIQHESQVFSELYTIVIAPDLHTG